MCLLRSSILSCSSFCIHVDARALCEAALSLKKLYLMINNGTHEALARIFALQPLEELVLFLLSHTEVSGACSPGMYVCMYVCMYVVVRCGLSGGVELRPIPFLLSLYVMCAAGG